MLLPGVDNPQKSVGSLGGDRLDFEQRAQKPHPVVFVSKMAKLVGNEQRKLTTLLN